MKIKHRIMSLLLCGLILYFSFSEIAFAGNVQEHTCTHEHTDACYVQVTACLYEADGADSAHGEDGTETTDTEETKQEHICSEESGCITRILLCPHVHDEHCGYFGTPEPVPVLSWEWIDKEEYLIQDENTGEWGLGLPGASEENPVTAEVLAELLPAEITAVFSDETTKVLPIEWDYAPLPESGVYEGTYTLTAVLPEEYTLDADAPVLEVLLDLGGGETMAVSQDVLNKHIVTEGIVNPPDATVNLFDYALTGTVDDRTPDNDRYKDTHKNCSHYRKQDMVFASAWGLSAGSTSYVGKNGWNIGINKNHFLLFGDAQIVHGGLWNRGGGSSSPYGKLFAGMQGIVNNTLTDGYPTINAGNALKKLDEPKNENGTAKTWTLSNVYKGTTYTSTYEKWEWVTDALLAGECQGNILYKNIDPKKAQVQNLSKTIIDNWNKANGKTFGTGAGQSTESLDYLFKPGNDNAYKKSYENVTGLFQMDDNGYYYYDMRKNFAELKEGADGNQFVLYDTPAGKGDGVTNNGNFFPFNKGEDVFKEVGGKLQSLIKEDSPGINHYFGLTLDLDFRQPVNGKVNSHNNAQDMIFEFSGDDDVWIYIDDTLVLDIGGVHSEIYGTINFATGEVNIGLAYNQDGSYAAVPKDPKNDSRNKISTTLYDLFKEAGTANKIKWNGKTFASNTEHTLKMFYLERGNYDSSMTLRFNLTSKLFQQIKKVDQDGKPLENVQFQLYAAQKVAGTENEYTSVGDVLTTLTTEADGLARFIEKGSVTTENPDGEPFNFADRYTNGTQYYILHESVTPDGYRELPKDIVLKYESDTAMLVVENPWVTGAYASFTSTVTGNRNITYGKLNTDTCDIESDGDNLGATATINGLVVAVPMLHEESTDTWKALYGSNVAGFSAVKPEQRTEDAWRKAVLTALLYQCSDADDNTPSWYLQWIRESNRFEGTLSDLPGRADRYRLNNASGDMKMVYAIISPAALSALGISTTAGTGAVKYQQLGDYVNGLMSSQNLTRDEAVATAVDEILKGNNSFRFLNTDQFSRNFRSLIYIPNEQRELRVWKVGDDGQGVNGATFTLYRDSACTDVAASGVTGTVGDRDGVLIFTPSPEKESGAAVKPGYAEMRWAASQHGTYYLRETQAPDGYTVNKTVIPVHVGTYSIYADAGTSDNGVTVMAGVGKLAQTMKKYAADNEVNITLRDITATAQKQPTGPFNPNGWTPVKLDGTQEDRSMNLHYGLNALVNYGLHDEDGGKTLYPYFVTDTGFITARVTQNYSALVNDANNKYGGENASHSANKTPLYDTDITSLFSLLNVVVVTDQKDSESEPKTGGLVISKTIVGEIESENEYYRNFSFKLELTNPDGTPFDQDAKFYFYGTDKSGYISSGGDILLHHDESMTILGLPEGTRFKVTETLNPEDGYTSIGGTVREGIIYAAKDGGSTAAAEFVNARGKNVPFTFTKVSMDNINIPLSGARFNLYWWSGPEGAADTELIPLTGAPVNSGWTPVGTAVSDANGLVNFGSLAKGTYRLIETAAPDGYILPQAQWQISVTVENDSMLIEKVSTVGVVDDKKPPAFAVETITVDGVTTYTYKLPNMSDVTLPFTGGRQTYRYMLFGAGLFCTAAGFAVWYSARGDRKKSRVKKC